MNNVFVNTVPHTGTHLITSVLDLIGFEHKIMNRRYYTVKPFFKKKSKASINWRASNEICSLGSFLEKKTVQISTGSPRFARKSTINRLFSQVSDYQYIIGHMPYSEVGRKIVEKHMTYMLTIRRDPREMLMSMIRHVSTRPEHPAYKYLFGVLPTFKHQLRAALSGFDNEHGRMAGVVDMYNSMRPWQESEMTLSLKFEDLIGEAGCGEAYRQFDSVKSILSQLGLSSSFSDEEILHIGRDAYGRGGTFRVGKQRSWKYDEENEVKELIKSELGLLLIELGYESDWHW